MDLTLAVEVGMVLAAFLLMRRMSEVTSISTMTREFNDREGPGMALDAPFFFGAAEKFKALRDVIRRFRQGGPRVILAGVHAQPMAAISRAPLLAEIGEAILVGGIDDALALAAPAA